MNELQKTRVLIIIPAYREEGRIASVVKNVHEYVDAVLVVDDGSGDDTAREAEGAGADVIRMPENKGKGVALNAGFDYAMAQGFEAVITLDGDGQHNPDDIPKFIETYERTHVPVLVGNRTSELEGMPRIRRWTNQFMSWLLSNLMKQYVADTQCGYRLYRCDVLPYVTAESARFAAESEALIHLAARGIEIGSVRIETIYGDEKSKIHPCRDSLRFFRMLLHFRRELRR
ncbi:MAG: glycosyltransferase family 2 protein [Verrucomicrobia bacterium]|nr:glycosyltransferase family 2 protein [Verrucomicrobiota bacterium]